MAKFYDITLRVRVAAKTDDDAYKAGVDIEEFARTVQGFEDSMIDFVDEVKED